MQLAFDATVIQPQKKSKKYDVAHLEGEQFGLLTVIGLEYEKRTNDGSLIQFWDCACNCEASFTVGGRKLTMFSHLVKGHTWCCDNCKRYYKTPAGAAVLANAKYRMRWFGKDLEEALVDAQYEIEVIRCLEM